MNLKLNRETAKFVHEMTQLSRQKVYQWPNFLNSTAHANGQASTLDFTRLKAANETVAGVNGVLDFAVNAHYNSAEYSSFAGRWNIVIGRKPKGGH